MPKDTMYTRSFDKAHASINRSFQLALDKTGRVPIGHHILDPRTTAKKAAFNLDVALNSQNASKGQLPSKVQNPQVAAAGKVVDPTAIETFQGADGVTVDTAGSGGFLPSSIIEGP